MLVRDGDVVAEVVEDLPTRRTNYNLRRRVLLTDDGERLEFQQQRKMKQVL
jgi:hypothetical protein